MTKIVIVFNVSLAEFLNSLDFVWPQVEVIVDIYPRLLELTPVSAERQQIDFLRLWANSAAMAEVVSSVLIVQHLTCLDGRALSPLLNILMKERMVLCHGTFLYVNSFLGAH
jgi:hypothetical protein